MRPGKKQLHTLCDWRAHQGTDLDTKGRVLAYDQTAYNVAVVPALSKNATTTKENLFKLGAKAEDVEAAFENSKLYPFQPWLSYRIYQNLTA